MGTLSTCPLFGIPYLLRPFVSRCLLCRITRDISSGSLCCLHLFLSVIALSLQRVSSSKIQLMNFGRLRGSGCQFWLTRGLFDVPFQTYNLFHTKWEFWSRSVVSDLLHMTRICHQLNCLHLRWGSLYFEVLNLVRKTFLIVTFCLHARRRRVRRRRGPDRESNVYLKGHGYSLLPKGMGRTR